jgi:hypothetical protein
MELGAVQLGFNLALHCPVEPRDRLHVHLAFTPYTLALV